MRGWSFLEACTTDYAGEKQMIYLSGVCGFFSGSEE